VPPVGKAQQFMADLFAKGREALGEISAESAALLTQVETWRQQIATFDTAAKCNEAMPTIKAIESPMVQAQAAKLLMDHGKAKGFEFDTKAKAFKVTEPVEA
jgi:hypothetical protein